MEQYIPKSALVAEIEKLYNGEIDTYTRNILDRLKSNIDTLKVKGVDLKKEFSQWWKDERAKDYNVDILYERYSNVSMKLAKYFFELGIQVSNKAQKGE